MNRKQKVALVLGLTAIVTPAIFISGMVLDRVQLEASGLNLIFLAFWGFGAGSAIVVMAMYELTRMKP